MRLDFSQSDPLVAARNAVGVAVPLLVGVALGNVPVAVFGAVGALFAAFADRPGSYRLRFSRMGLTALATGVCGGLAVLCAHSVVLSLLLIAIFAFISGMLLSLGPAAAQVGIAGTAMVVVFNRFPLPASGALGIAAVIIAAGLFQSLLAVVGWPVHRHAPERAILANLYEGLAKRTRWAHPEMMAPGAGALLESARATITGYGHGHGPSMRSYRGLLDEAERIRLEVIALAYCIDRFERVDRREQADAVRSLLAAAGPVLDAAATSLRHGKAFAATVLNGDVALGRPMLDGDAVLDQLTAALARLETVMAGHPDSPTGRFAQLHGRALAGQLRACARMVTPGAVEGRITDDSAKVGGIRLAVQGPLATIRANLAPDSAVFRHALRLAVLVTIADGASRLLPHADRGYWIPLMVLMLLRPDFGTTLFRTSARLAGTLLGLGIGTAATFLTGSGNPYVLVALVLVFVFGVRISGLPNAFFMSIWTAAYLVALLDLAGFPAGDVVLPRMLDTLVAGVLVLAASLVWPAWERSFLPRRIAELLNAYGDYLVAVADPKTPKSRIDATRIAARLARSNAQASLDRTAAEPVSGQSTLFVGEGVLVQSHLFIQAAMVIDAARLSAASAQHPVEQILQPLAPFVADAAKALTACATAARLGRAPHGKVNMRGSYAALKEAMGPGAPQDDVVRPAILDAADRIANSVDTMAHLMRRQPAAQGSEPVAR